MIKLEAKLQEKRNETLNQIETFWFQISGVEAIHGDDHNTRYFYLSTIIQRRRNKIEVLQNTKGVRESNLVAVKNMVLDYFTSLFADSSH